MTITITKESEYAHGLVFESVDTVLEHVGSLAPHRDCTRYPDDSDAAYVARLLDLPGHAVSVCAQRHYAGMARAAGRFEPNGPTGYQAASGGPMRARRAQAVLDECRATHSAVRHD